MKVEALFGLSVLVSFLAFRRRLEAEAIALRKIFSTSSVGRRSMKAITCWTATLAVKPVGEPDAGNPHVRPSLRRS